MKLEVLWYFLKLGLFGFGGPLALIAAMQRDLVEKRRWISEGEFTRAFSLVKAMPGPVAFQMAVYIGRRSAGFWGGTAAGFGVVFPAFVMMIAISFFYSSLSHITQVQSFMLGMQAAALAIIVVGLRSLFLPHKKNYRFWALVLGAATLTHFFPRLEPVVIIGFGIVWVLQKKVLTASLALPLTFQDFLVGAASQDFFSNKVMELIWVSLKAGAFVFGSGLAIVPLLEADFVTRLGWLTHNEFMDALAFGQITPGPVVITATFIGFKVGGFVGALLATIAIFLPAYFHMITWFPPLLDKLSRLSWIQDFVFGAVAAVVGSIAITVFQLAWVWKSEPRQWLVILVVFLVAWFSKVPTWALIPSAGLAGLLLYW